MSLNTFMPVMTSPKTMPRYSRMGLPSMELVVVTIILTSSVCHWIRLCRAYSISRLAALSSPQPSCRRPTVPISMSSVVSGLMCSQSRLAAARAVSRLVMHRMPRRMAWRCSSM